VKERVFAMNSTHQQGQIHPLLSTKHQLKIEKRARNQTAAKEDKKSGELGGRTAVPPRTDDRVPLTTVHGEHHWLTMVASGCRSPVASRTLRFGASLDLEICLGSPILGQLGFLFNLSLLGWASTHTFLLKTWPDTCKSAIKTQQSQN